MITRVRFFVRYCLTLSGIAGLTRHHKRILHTLVLSTVAVDLMLVGAKLADLGFLALCLLIELEEIGDGGNHAS